MVNQNLYPSREKLVQFLVDALTVPWPESTHRRVWSRVTFPGKATAVAGMRRVGKTTFLHQMRQARHADGIARERLPYLNFEDERLAGFRAEDFSIFVEEYYRRFPQLRGNETVIWCFDEIQVVAGWERFVRRLLDTEKVEIFVSGSSSALLSKEIATALRGRCWEVDLFPFSFEEYLRHHGIALPDRIDLVSARQRSALEGALRDYLVTGGFPEAQGIDSATRYRLLSDYVDLAMLRDVVERYNVRNIASLRWLVRHLLGNPGGLFSVEKFHAALKSQGLAISRDTLHQLLRHLEDCFLVRLTWVETASERRRMVNPRKAYPIDPGLIPVFNRSGKANLGHALETVVRIELERRNMQVSYVRTSDGFEVDFLARTPEGEESLLQVAADLGDDVTREREIRALQSAAREHPRASLHLITLAPETAGPIPQGIQVHNAALWLLAPWLL
ncbi:MAG TPA: ATP-binding protein [Bacteroidetes bacterium]|nr:ATP-binding protein [Bacteroidota bacterium]